MKFFATRALVLFSLILLLGGCASYDTQMIRGRSLKDVRRFFILSNSNDNHAIDRQIAEVLKARGREAETGPETMMPENTQAVITYMDRWAWDFGDHLVFLQLSVKDANHREPFATVTFGAKIPLREDASVTIARLVDQLLDKK